jgi:hypothetical protein
MVTVRANQPFPAQRLQHAQPCTLRSALPLVRIHDEHTLVKPGITRWLLDGLCLALPPLAVLEGRAAGSRCSVRPLAAACSEKYPMYRAGILHEGDIIMRCRLHENSSTLKSTTATEYLQWFELPTSYEYDRQKACEDVAPASPAAWGETHGTF